MILKDLLVNGLVKVLGKVYASGGFVGNLEGNATSANTAMMPLGFNSRSTGATWGNTTGTSFTSWNDSTGGSIDFRQDNPSAGKMSLKVDGRVYVNEGLNAVLSGNLKNVYWGMCTPDGIDSDWIRTTSAGIIPYQDGTAGKGHCSLGTQYWYFNSGYIDEIYGHLNGSCSGSSGSCSGNAATATTAKNIPTSSGQGNIWIG